jgi:hypothetical protein
VAGAGGLEDAVITTCPVCRRSLALADRSGRHVASEAHYPHADANGTMICSPLTPAEWGNLTIDGDRRAAGGTPPRLVTAIAR